MRIPRLSVFYVRSGLFALLSMGGAVFNYALYPALTRVLDARSFGDFTVIMALSNQILGILLAFNLTSIYLVKTYPEHEARQKAQTIQKLLIWFFVLATVATLAASPLIKHSLHIESIFSFFILAFILLAAIPAVIWTGYLQGHKRLVQVGLFALSSALCKFVFAIALARVSGVAGGLWGVLAGTLAGLAILYLSTRQHLKLPAITGVASAFTAAQRAFITSFRSYIVISIIVVGCLSILQNIDITYAKALFNPRTAGIYSGISIISNGLYYVSFLLVWILLPEISPKDMPHNRQILRTAYKFLGLIAAAAVAAELVLGRFIARFLLGSQFGSQGNLLIFASLFQLSLVAVTLYAYYLLVLRDRRALILGAAVFGSALILPRIFSRDPQSMIISLVLAVLCGVAVYGIINAIIPQRSDGRHYDRQRDRQKAVD